MCVGQMWVMEGCTVRTVHEGTAVLVLGSCVSSQMIARCVPRNAGIARCLFWVV